MESRYSVRSRFGEDGGSIKSRILASEESNNPSSNDFSKIKKSRQVVDARAFRNAEGVKSRLNKFLNADSPTTNASSRIGKKERNRQVKPEAREVVNGNITRNRACRKKFEENYDENNNNQNIKKSPVITNSKYSKEYKTTEKINTNEGTIYVEKSVSKVTEEVEETTNHNNDRDATDKIRQKIHEPTENCESNRPLENEALAPLQDKLANNALPADDVKELQDEHRVNGMCEVKSEEDKALSGGEEEGGLTNETSLVEDSPYPDVTNDESVDGKDANDTDDVRNDVTPTSSTEDVPSTFATSSLQDQSGEFPSVDESSEKKSTPDVVVEKVASEAKTSSDALPITEAEEARGIPEEKKPKHDAKPLELNDLKESSEAGTTAGRRRRRGRRSQESSNSSTASSSASTPDPKTGSLPLAKTQEPSGDEQITSAETPDSGAAVVFSLSPPTPDAFSRDEEEIPTILEVKKQDEGHTIASEESQKVEVTEDERNEKSTSERNEHNNGEASDSATIKLKRVYSAPEQSIELMRETKATVEVKENVEEKLSADNAGYTQPVSTETTKTVETSDADMAPQASSEIRYTLDNLEECTEESILKKMLDETTEYEDRKRIRSAIRALRKSKEAGGAAAKQKGSASTRWKTRTTTTTDMKKDRNATSARTTKKDVKETKSTTQRWQNRSGTTLGGDKESRVPADPKSLAEKYGLNDAKKDSSNTGSEKVGSIFDREDEEPKKSSSRADLERRRADRRRELTRNRSMPADSHQDARKMFVAKLEGENANKGGSAVKKVGRSPTFVVPNANNVKQMLLKWCQAKTRGYEHVDINNFSGSWSSGMAFCALVHNFFPDAFDYNELDPKNKAHNFDLAFNTAEERGDIPSLLDTEDMVGMAEPDWKCIYTYLTEFYKSIRELGLS